MRSFQGARHLPVDGTCGQVTWAALEEAGHRLGDRLLYLARPMLRGDDVAELQRRLGRLGFDAGRVDGIFGPDTERALLEFQRNVGGVTDGVCGPEARAALERVATRAGADAIVAGVRERERLRGAPRTVNGRVVVLAARGPLAPLALGIGRALRADGASILVVADRDPSIQARRANEAGADVVVALEPTEGVAEVAYYATAGFESSGGRQLAQLLAAAVGATLGSTPAPSGRTTPILRETRAPAALCRLGPAGALAAVPTAGLAEALAAAVLRWVAAPIDPDPPASGAASTDRRPEP